MLASYIDNIDNNSVMEKENSSSRALQEISIVIAGVLPIAQLFFAKLPEAFTQLFISPQYFTGVSIITLILSYIFIIAYQSRPFFTLTLPFQKK